MLKDRLTQLALLLVAAAALLGASLLHGPIEKTRRDSGMTIVADSAELSKDWKMSLLKAFPGGIRAPFVTYLWIRSQQLKDDGRFFDAMGQRDLICDLMPHFPGVWAFHGWDMAWNISVATHTPQERWMWVHNGVRLLRDRGLHYNPNDLVIHKELSWIFFSKIGGTMDDMHWVYKLRWLELMQFTLGAPPVSDEIDSAAKAFRPIAEAPQEFDQLSAEAKAFVAELAERKIKPDESFLQQYNGYSDDPLAFRTGPRKTDKETPVGKLMTSPAHAQARAELLAFVRAKTLRETYRMDPRWMLTLMERYGPLDWRHSMSHAIYWATMGLHRARGLNLADMKLALADIELEAAEKLTEIHTLNTERNVLNGLKELGMTGQLYYAPGLRERERLISAPDWRFIEAAHREYTSASAHLMKSTAAVLGKRDALRNAHITFLNNSSLVLYVAGREKEARRYYDILRNDLLGPPLDEVHKKNLHDFVMTKVRSKGALTSRMYLAFRHGALVRAYRALIEGDMTEFRESYAYARKVYQTFSEGSGRYERLKPRTFEWEEALFLRILLIDPRAVGLRVPLVAKARLYHQLPLYIRQRLARWPDVAKKLEQECLREEMNFKVAFPGLPSQRRPGGLLR